VLGWEVALDGQIMGERRFMEDGIRQRCRCDGRSLLVSRELEVRTGTNDLACGSASVSLDLRTPHILCTIKSEVISTSSPDHGDLSFSLTISEIRNPLIKRQEQELSSALDTLLLAHINRSQLLILPGYRAWRLGIDVTVLESDCGNMLDHACLAIHAALTDVKLPNVKGFLNANSEEVTLEVQDGDWSLQLPDLPLIFTAWKLAGELVADVNGKEQSLAQGCLHVSVAPSGLICGVLKDSKD
jgi:exosome complex RNA-binding protein Rrp42 (RNase PH superfamily)